MQAEHLDVADLVFQAVGGALRLRRPDERNRSLQSEDQRCPRAAEDQISTRNLEHFYLPGLILPVAPVFRRAPTCVLPRAAQAIPQRCLVWSQPRCRREMATARRVENHLQQASGRAFKPSYRGAKVCWIYTATYGFSPWRCDSVKISTPSAVTPTECSNCADSERSRVTAVQPSDRIFTCGLPRLIIGSMVKNMPGFSGTPSPGRPIWMMLGSSWNRRPSPWPQKSRTTLMPCGSTKLWMAWPMSPVVAPGFTAAMPRIIAS